MTHWIASFLLLAAVVGSGLGLAAWKEDSQAAAEAEAASMPEPAETITAALAAAYEHRRTTTAVGTVIAPRSVVLRNELPGTVVHVALRPGEIVEENTLLVAFDVSVEEAEIAAYQAQLALAETLLARVERASARKAVSAMEVDRARAERDVAKANIERVRAIVEKKTIRAPFRARVGLSDLHPGQYLHQGTEITTLQGVGDHAHVDFHVPQHVAATLSEGDGIDVIAAGRTVDATIVAVDARVDDTTRNAMVRARIDAADAPAPGAAVRVRVPVGEPEPAVAVPVSALRRGPAGDHVFVLEPDGAGALRAHVRGVKGGAMLGDLVLVHEGLEPGDRVAASGSFKLREGALVLVAE